MGGSNVTQPIIRMRNIYKRFYIGQPNELEILHGIDLDVMPGEFLSIVGPSGSTDGTHHEAGGRHSRTRTWAECSECHVCGSPQWKACPVCDAKMVTDSGK